MGIGHAGDKTIETGQFTPIPDDDYTINKFEFIPEGTPTFKPILGVNKIMLRTLQPNGKEGPAVSLTPAEYVAFVQTLGGSVKGGYKQRMNVDFLEAAKASITGDTRMTVHSKNGWANFLPISLPEGMYTIQFVRAHRPRYEEVNKYHFASQQGKNGIFETLLFDFEVVGDGTGKSSIYNGFILSEYMNNPFTKEFTDDEGEVTTVYEEGRPYFKRDDRTGGEPAVVQLWELFIKFFVPEINNHEWQSDPTKSEYGVDELDQPQYPIIHKALAAERKLKMWVGKKERSDRVGINLRNLPIANATETLDLDEETEQATSLIDLITYIEQRWDKGIFDNSDPTNPAVVFTDGGIEWAGIILGEDGGPWDRANMPKRGTALHLLKDDQIARLLHELKAQHGEKSSETGW